MIQFESIELFEVDMAMSQSIVTGHGVIGSRRILLVKGTTPQGIVWSECGALSIPTYHYETIDTAFLALSQWVLPKIVGKNFESPEAVRVEMEQGINGHYFAKASIEMASWAVAALEKTQSLATLLGGTYSSVQCGAVISARSDVGLMGEEALELVRMGYRRIKVKIMPGVDPAVLTRLRAVLPSSIQLFADANGSYSGCDNEMVVSICRSGIDLFEQPFRKDEFLRHRVIQKMSPVPVCLDESIESIDHLETAAVLGACQSISIKPGRVGGIGPALAIYRRAIELGIEPWLGGMFETGIGRAYNLAISGVIQGRWIGDMSPSGRYWANDLVLGRDEIAVGDGMAINYLENGANFVVDEALVSRLTIRKQKIANPIPMNYSK